MNKNKHTSVIKQIPGIKIFLENVLAPSIIGKDPIQTESRFRDMAQAGNALEIGGAIWIGIAGLDIAMWDLRGKAMGLPIYELLGGKVRGQMPIYARFTLF